ncbi:hypothetical protein EDB85DRAFT_2297190 [Lactarius pseudohatsudake]|nr:hypothetical protein EDB85DRAFT_2297190 [Lactarius pseudohatsudake]
MAANRSDGCEPLGGFVGFYRGLVPWALVRMGSFARPQPRIVNADRILNKGRRPSVHRLGDRDGQSPSCRRVAQRHGRWCRSLRRPPVDSHPFDHSSYSRPARNTTAVLLPSTLASSSWPGASYHQHTARRVASQRENTAF